MYCTISAVVSSGVDSSTHFVTVVTDDSRGTLWIYVVFEWEENRRERGAYQAIEVSSTFPCFLPSLEKGRAPDNKKERDDFISKIWWWRRLPVNPPSSSQPEWNTSAKSTALHHWRRLKSHVTHQRKSIEKVFLFFSLLRTLVYSNIRPFRLHEHNSIISPNQRYWNPIAIYFLAKWNWSKLFLITPMLLSIWCFNFVHSQQHYIV